MRGTLMLLLALVSTGGPLWAQNGATAVPQRYRSVSLNPGEKCPPPVGDEVVVCRTEEEPYRLPKALRHPEIPPQNQSWVNRAAETDEVSRVAGGLPDTCSVVGTGGQSGCGLTAAREWAAERRQARQEAAAIPWPS